jgi:hypothetical protein
MGIVAQPTRENRTITVDFRNETTYVQLLDDGKALVEWVMRAWRSWGLGRFSQLLDLHVRIPPLEHRA